jgi:cell division protein FtsB
MKDGRVTTWIDLSSLILPLSMNHANPTTNGPTLKGWITSVLFWLAVLAAAGMYALVALSPKVLAWHDERERWRKNQERLVRLERKVEYLKQVANALESDPEFAAELARVELHASRPGDERLPVERRLALTADKQPSRTANGVVARPWFEPILRDFAEDGTHRRWTLFAAAALVVIAFTFLQESPARKPDADEGTWLGRRYGRKHRTS